MYIRRVSRNGVGTPSASAPTAHPGILDRRAVGGGHQRLVDADADHSADPRTAEPAEHQPIQRVVGDHGDAADRGGGDAGVRPTRGHVRAEADARRLRADVDRRIADRGVDEFADAADRRAEDSRASAYRSSRSASACCGSCVPAERVGSAMGLMSASLGVGGALGLPLSAVIAQHYDWHVLFWFSTGLGVAALLMFATLVPHVPPRSADRLDPLGALLAGGRLGDAAARHLEGPDLGLGERARRCRCSARRW